MTYNSEMMTNLAEEMIKQGDPFALSGHGEVRTWEASEDPDDRQVPYISVGDAVRIATEGYVSLTAYDEANDDAFDAALAVTNDVAMALTGAWDQPNREGLLLDTVLAAFGWAGYDVYVKKTKPAAVGDDKE